MSRRTVATLVMLLAAGLLLALRLPHLTGPLDDPHSWRQCDTAAATREFARHGIDLLHPAVVWLGGHKTLLFECPIPEAIAAVAMRVSGIESPFWDRLVAFVFFLVSAGYLFAIARRLLGPGHAAGLATLAYLASPLAQYYSRAANVDFAAQAFAHAFLWHGLRAIDTRRVPHAIVATLTGALAALIKAPYLAPVAVPLALATLASGAVAAWLLAALAVAGPAIAFVLWRRHVDATNALVPDWNWLPGFYKEVNPLWWYVGDWKQRLEPAVWIKLARRMVFEVASPGLAVVALLGLWPARRDKPAGPVPVAFVLAWLLGAFAYMLVFFPLNVIHNYYQVPFVAPLALLVGLGGARLIERLPSAARVPIGAVLLAVALAFATLMPARLGWYRIDTLRDQAAASIRELTPPGQLIVAVDHNTMFTDPRLLYRADRFGWPLAAEDVTPDRLVRLRALGARWLVWVERDDGVPTPPAGLLATVSRGSALVDARGMSLGTLRIWPIDAAIPASGGTTEAPE